MKFLFIVMLMICVQSIAQNDDLSIRNDSLNQQSFERGAKNVNKCTPWNHIKCVYITGAEVYKDGSKGKSTRHWWRMSYIGRACTAQYGKTFGYIFEGFFAIPHYITLGITNSVGFIKYIILGSPEKIQIRKHKRMQRRILRKGKRKN